VAIGVKYIVVFISCKIFYVLFIYYAKDVANCFSFGKLNIVLLYKFLLLSYNI